MLAIDASQLCRTILLCCLLADAALSGASSSALGAPPNGTVLAGVYPVDLRGDPELGYYLRLSVGTPGTDLGVLIDTGSSNFAIAGYADECVMKFFNASLSSSFASKQQVFTVRYTEGQWSGALGVDAVTLATVGSVRANLSVISRSEKLFVCSSQWEGILGLAYQSISLPGGSVKPYFDELVSNGRIAADVFSLQLCLRPDAVEDGTPNADSAAEASSTGKLVFGGVDASLYEGQFYDVPLVAKRYYEVLIVDLAVQNRSLGLGCREYNTKRTIVDSGTTTMSLPSQVHAKLIAYLRDFFEAANVSGVSHEFWNGSEAVCWTSSSAAQHINRLPTVTLRLLSNGTHVVALELAPSQYLLRAGNWTRNRSEECFKLAISISGDVTIIGAQSMTAYYVRFDRAHQQVGFAKSACDTGTATGRATSRLSWQANVDGWSVAGCAFDDDTSDADRSGGSAALVVACVVLAAAGVSALIALVAVKLRRQLSSSRRSAGTNMRAGLVTEMDPDT